MRNFLLAIVINLIFINPIFAQDILLKGSVVKVPDAFWGTWRVTSKLVDTDSPYSFKDKGLDLWNLSFENNVVKLSNPFSGAVAEIKLEEVSNEAITFSKIGNYDNKVVTDKVNIVINKDEFVGTNELILKTVSDVDGSVRKLETATYSIKGEKISGQSITGN